MKFTSIFFATSVSILEIYLKDTKKKRYFLTLQTKRKRGQSPAPSPLKQIILMSLFSLFFTAKIRKIFHISYSKYTQKTASTCNQ